MRSTGAVKNSTKLGKTSRLVFKLTQHSRDEELMRAVLRSLAKQPPLINFFGVGKIYKSRDTVYLHVTKIEDINEGGSAKPCEAAAFNYVF